MTLIHLSSSSLIFLFRGHVLANVYFYFHNFARHFSLFLAKANFIFSIFATPLARVAACFSYVGSENFRQSKIRCRFPVRSIFSAPRE